ncbi:MAG: hydrogenase nickel incorporation protein HypB [Candidatus Lernaella stagnicola]|nr:hydrogenase nickel incorporation protein HypB [Candidatus Lernaella stagnicola]
MTTSIPVGKDPRNRNQLIAAGIRDDLAKRGIYCINLISSPGSGKTTLLECALPTLGENLRLAVIEADAATTNDADRLEHIGVRVEPLVTGITSCHIAQPSAKSAFDKLDLDALEFIVIENVGNLVCPAEEDLGEDDKIAMLSVAEGEDKPLKYPLLFQEATLALVNKIDAADALGADVDLMERNIRAVNPHVEVIRISARTGQGVDEFVKWILARCAAKRPSKNLAE